MTTTADDRCDWILEKDRDRERKSECTWEAKANTHNPVLVIQLKLKLPIFSLLAKHRVWCSPILSTFLVFFSSKEHENMFWLCLPPHSSYYHHRLHFTLLRIKKMIEQRNTQKKSKTTPNSMENNQLKRGWNIDTFSCAFHSVSQWIMLTMVKNGWWWFFLGE